MSQRFVPGAVYYPVRWFPIVQVGPFRVPDLLSMFTIFIVGGLLRYPWVRRADVCTHFTLVIWVPGRNDSRIARQVSGGAMDHTVGECGGEGKVNACPTVSLLIQQVCLQARIILYAELFCTTNIITGRNTASPSMRPSWNQEEGARRARSDCLTIFLKGW